MNTFNFPETVKAYLDRTKRTQRDLARDAGISEVTLSKIMTGTCEPSGATIKRLWPFVSSPSPTQPEEVRP